MNRFVLLRDQVVDGNGGGGNSAPATSQPNQQSSQGDQQVKDVWGGRSAPDWIKQASLGAVHDKSNVGAPVETDPMAPAGTQSQPGQAPAQQQQQAPAQVQQQAAPAAAVQQQVQQSPAAVAITSDTIAEAMVKAQGLAAQRTGNPQAQPTVEEVRRQLGVVEVSADDYEAILGVKPDKPERLAALNKVLQGIAQQAVNISTLLNQRSLDAQNGQIAPYLQTVRQQEVVRQQSLFAQENPDLRGYEALAEKEFKVATAEGRKFPTVEVARKYIADQVRLTLKAANIVPVATAQQQQSSGSGSPAGVQQQQRRMTTTSVGGRGGNSGAPASQSASKVEAVWGKK